MHRRHFFDLAFRFFSLCSSLCIQRTAFPLGRTGGKYFRNDRNGGDRFPRFTDCSEKSAPFPCPHPLARRTGYHRDFYGAFSAIRERKCPHDGFGKHEFFFRPGAAANQGNGKSSFSCLSHFHRRGDGGLYLSRHDPF